MDTLFEPPDMMEANRAWQASCGPGAFAALTGRTLAATRPFFPDFPAKTWVTPTMMGTALGKAGLVWKITDAVERDLTHGCGLAFVQFSGSWLNAGVPPTVRYRHTHWVAANGGQVYDANAGAWMPHAEWTGELAPYLVANKRGCTGWFVWKFAFVKM